MSKPSLVSVLAEDSLHQAFVRRFLLRCGFLNHQIRLGDLPGSRGCGEQWVRERYIKEVAAYRGRASRANTALVVIIDADRGEISHRSRQLESLGARLEGERIVHLIPRRSIETWILCLNNVIVDEETDYSHRPGSMNKLPAPPQSFSIGPVRTPQLANTAYRHYTQRYQR